MSEPAIGARVYIGGIPGRYVGWERLVLFSSTSQSFVPTQVCNNPNHSLCGLGETAVNSDYPLPPDSLVWEVYQNAGRVKWSKPR